MSKSSAHKNLIWSGGQIDLSSGTAVMGILNVTPDSFSDGGRFFDPQQAIEHGMQMAVEGAGIIDVGAESTRPGAQSISAEEQIARAVPVIKALASKISIPISIDTFDPKVAQAALDSGASIINDITALANPHMAQLAATRQVPVIVMHMQGTPQTMQKQPHYGDVVAEVKTFLLQCAQKAQTAGIIKEMIIIDPGIGFGKTMEHNLDLLRHIDEFVATGYHVLVGTSRKKFIGTLTGKDIPSERIFGTAASVALAAAAGVSIVRVHDVAAMVDVIRVSRAISNAD